MEYQFNEFTAGVDLDTDNSKVVNTVLRDLYNGRIIEKHGRGLVATNLPGNDFLFNNPTGKCIGKIVYKGIAFTFYQNGLGQGEIGTFPSPNLTTPGFTSVYTPLQNFNATDMISSQFDFDLDHMIEGEAVEDSDGSVNLYFCDGKNVDRCINSGFKMDGTTNNRGYTTSNLLKRSSLFLDSWKHPKFALSSIDQGGAHKAGTYIFFLRFCTSTYDSTPFKGESNAVQISPDDDNPAANANISQADGQVTDYITKKQVRFNLTNLDTDFDYFEIAYIYYGNAGVQEIRLIDKKYAISAASVNGFIIRGDEPVVALTYSDIIRRNPLTRISKTLTLVENRIWRGDLLEVDSYNDFMKEFASRITCSYEVLDLNPVSNFLAAGIYKNYLNKYDHVGYWRGEAYPFGCSFNLISGVDSDTFPCTGADFWAQSQQATTNPKGIFRFPNLYVEPVIGDSAGHNPEDMTTGNTQVRLIGIKFDFTAAKAYLNATPAAKAYFEASIRGIHMMRGECKRNTIYQGFLLSCYQMDFGDNTSNPTYKPDDNGGGVNAYEYQNFLRLPNMGGTGQFFTDYKFLKTNWRKFPLYKRKISAEFPIDDYYDPHGAIYKAGFAAIPIQIWRDKTFSGNNQDINYYTEAYPGLDSFFIINPPSNNRFPQAPATDSRALYSLDYHFKKSFADGNYTLMMWGGFDMNEIDMFIAGDSGVYHGSALYAPPIIAASYNTYKSAYTTIDEKYAKWRVEAYGINEWEVADKQGFVSMFVRGNKDEKYGWFYLESQNGAGAKRYAWNRAIATNKYIGLKYISYNGDLRSATNEILNPITGTNVYGTNDYDMLNKLVSIYQRDPLSIVIADIYDPPKITYRRISDQIVIVDAFGVADINLIPDTLACWKGDSYINYNTIKVAINPDELGVPIEDKSIDDNDSIANDTELNLHDVKAGFGTMLGFPSENVYNVAMRITLENSKNTYYDFTGDLNAFSIQNVSKESDEFNTGYNQVLGELACFGFDVTVPYRNQQRPYAISNTHEMVSGLYTDALRLTDLAAIRDFNSHLGPIVKLVNHFGMLMCIQHKGINLHYVNERVTIPSNAGSITIGTGDVLSPKTRALTDGIGSQHRMSIVKTKIGTYGIDVNKRKVWRVVGEQFQLLSVEKRFNKLLHDIFDTAFPVSDQTIVIGDSPANDAGIAAGYDAKFEEVVWTARFLSEDILSTFVYNEKLDFYQGQRDVHCPVYITVNNDLLGNDFASMNSFYQFNIEKVGIVNNYGLFFAAVVPVVFRIDFIVNGIALQMENIEKVFNNYEIISDGNILDSIKYDTQLQHGLQQPFDTVSFAELYCKPVLKENTWYGAIRRADSVDGIQTQYLVKSEFRDKWLLFSLRYKLSDLVAVKGVNTWFDKSYI